MAVSKFDVRQAISRDLLDQIANATGTELDNILRALNVEVSPPLRMSASTPGDQILNIDSIFITNPETGRNRTIPTISNTLPNFTGGTVTVPTSSGGTVTVAPGTNNTLTLTSGNFIKMGIALDASGQLSVQFGIEAATIAAATAPPSVNNTFALGYLVIENVAGTIQTVENSDIYQYVGGGGGGGSGDANSYLETLKNMLNDSVYEFITPNIFSRNEDTLIDVLGGTAVYSLVTQNVNFPAAADSMTSTQMLDDDFLNESRDVGSVQLAAQWGTGAIDTAAVYTVSRDGGNEYQTITMSQVGESDTFQGSLTFAAEAANQSINTQAASTGTQALDATTNQRVGNSFTLAAAAVLKEVDLTVTLSGSPIGNMYIQIVNDDTALPSLTTSDLLSESPAIDISTLANGVNTLTLADTVLPAGTYHFVVRTDSTYTTEFTSSAGANSFVLAIDGTANGLSTYNGTVWADSGTNALTYDLKGRTLDLRVRVTAGTNTTELSGYGILYDLQSNGVSTGSKNRQVFKFNSVTDNDNEFTLTQFVPDPDLLQVYLAETGQVFRAPSFVLDGKKVVFPVNTFNNGGVSEEFTLIFESLTGSSFDNSDQNALLMAGNFLGSTDVDIDRSANGRGIFIRRPDGTLRELTIDNTDNIQIFSV